MMPKSPTYRTNIKSPPGFLDKNLRKHQRSAMAGEPQRLHPCPNHFRSFTLLAMRTRVALIGATAVVSACIGILSYLPRTTGHPLTITPAGEPQFTFPEKDRTDIAVVSLTVAVTNNTRAKLLVCVGAVRATRLLEGTPEPFRIWRPYNTDPLSRDGQIRMIHPSLELRPKAGALCTVRYMKGEPQCVLGADYHIVESPLKAKVRLLLHTCGLRSIRTNDVWHTLQVAKIEQH